jgi:hypothetical protein
VILGPLRYVLLLLFLLFGLVLVALLRLDRD